MSEDIITMPVSECSPNGIELLLPVSSAVKVVVPLLQRVVVSVEDGTSILSSAKFVEESVVLVDRADMRVQSPDDEGREMVFC